MAQQTTCPNCRRDFRVPDALVGRAVRCPTCAATFQSEAAENGISLTPIAPPPAPPVAEPAEALPEVRPERPRYGPRLPRYPRRDVEPHRGTLILVLGIVAFFLFPYILGPIAWVLGSTDIKKIRAGQMDPAGESNTNAGRICGIIATIYGLVHVLFLVVMIAFAFGMIALAPRPVAPFPAPPTAPVRPLPTAPFKPPRPPFPNQPPIDDPLDIQLRVR